MSFSLEQERLVQEEVKKLVQKGAVSPVGSTPGEFLSQLFVIPKSNREEGGTAINKSEGSEQVHKRRALQDGRIPYDQRFSERRGLVGKSRPKGCIFPHSCSSDTSEIPTVSVEGSDIPVSLSPIWPVLCSMGVEKGDETSDSLFERARHALDNLPGRYLDVGGGPSQVEHSVVITPGIVSSFGVGNKQ